MPIAKCFLGFLIGRTEAGDPYSDLGIERVEGFGEGRVA